MSENFQPEEGSIGDRIAHIAKREGITVFELEREIGASKGTLYKAVRGNTDIQSKWLSKLAIRFPHYSAKWLLTGIPPETPKDQPISSYSEVMGKGNVVANGNGVSIKLGEDRPQSNLVSSTLLEQIIRDKEDQIRKLSEMLSKAHDTIHALTLAKIGS